MNLDRIVDGFGNGKIRNIRGIFQNRMDFAKILSVGFCYERHIVVTVKRNASDSLFGKVFRNVRLRFGLRFLAAKHRKYDAVGTFLGEYPHINEFIGRLRRFFGQHKARYDVGAVFFLQLRHGGHKRSIWIAYLSQFLQIRTGSLDGIREPVPVSENDTSDHYKGKSDYQDQDDTHKPDDRKEIAEILALIHYQIVIDTSDG